MRTHKYTLVHARHAFTANQTTFIKFGDKGIRTPDLTGAIRALYQLSYIPLH